MTTTDHAQEAAGALIKSREWLEDEEFARADLAVKRAQAHATLAVAHELRPDGEGGAVSGTKRPSWRKRHHCPHSELEPIYGDEINALGGFRLRCRDCGRLIDGPPTLAASRKDEPTWKYR